ncbi:MAG TPA: hypothetical protein VGD22_06800 [Sphingobacteriaceae bacterium]
MKSRFSILAFSLLILVACNQKKDNKLSQVKEIKQQAGKVDSSSNAFVQSETLQINEASAVYFHPDSIKLQKLEQTLGDKFFADAEVSMGNLSTSRDYLIRNKIKVVETEARQLTFKKADGTVKTVDLSNSKYTWGLLLFNGIDDPIEVDMAKPEKATDAYMKK